MKRNFYIILYMTCICLILVACHKQESPNMEQNSSETSGSVTQQPTLPLYEQNYKDGTYTLMVYMCGSSLETNGGYATKNVSEMLSADIPENTKVIIQTGGAKKWRAYDISQSHSSRYEIRNGELVLIEQHAPVNMGLSSSLEDFLIWGEEKYPAEHRSVIFWDHGNGSIKGVCNDEQFFHDSLSLPEIQSAFAKVYEKSGRKYEFVGFDACLMATYDTACILEPYANYMIASEELEPSTGWDYKVLLSNLGTDHFYNDVLNSYAEKQSKKATYTLSVINLLEMERANEVILKITEQLNYNVPLVAKTLKESKEFGAATGADNSGSNLFDLGLFAESLGLEYDYSGFIANVNGEAHEEATGMSLYFPTEQEEMLDEYRSVCQNLSYIKFLVDYFNYQSEKTIEFENKGYDNDGCLSFTLTEFSKKYVQSVGYELLSFVCDEETQKLYSVGKDNDVYYADGEYTVDFHGNWIFLNDMILHSDVYEESDTHTIFSIPVKIEGEFGFLLFTYSKPTQSITVEGYVIESEHTSRIHNLMNGMEISILYEDTVLEGTPIYYEEGTVIWSEDVDFSIMKLDAGYYQYVPYVVDIYGDVHYAYTATVYFDGEKCIIESIAA